MGIGHVAVGLGLKSADRRLNVGFLIFAALFADFLLGWFTLAGWESYEIPPDYATKHYLLFTFPWSHGLLPDLGWATGLGVVTAILLRSLRAGAIGYLLKDAPSEKLGEAIRSAARGESFLQPSVAAKVVAEFARLTSKPAMTVAKR